MSRHFLKDAEISSPVGDEGAQTPTGAVGDEGAQTPTGARTPSSRLDSLPREDLVKFVKKQLIVSQKTKQKCDELNKENERLKEQAKESSNEVYQKKIKNLEERVECMIMKDETMTSTFQCLQTEYDQLKLNNKELCAEVSVLTEARDDGVVSIKSLTQELTACKQQATQTQQKLHSEKESLLQSYHGLEGQISALQSEMELLTENEHQLNTKIQQLEAENENCVQVSENEALEKHLREMSDKLRTFEEEKLCFVEKINQFDQAKSGLNEQVSDLVKEKSLLYDKYSELEVENERLNEKCSKLGEERVNEKSRVTEQQAEDVVAYEETVRTLEQEKALLYTRYGDLEERCDQLQEQNHKCRADLQGVREENVSLHQKLKEWEDMMNMLQMERDQIQAMLDQSEQQQHNTGTELHDLTTALQEALQERDTLRDQIMTRTDGKQTDSAENTKLSDKLSAADKQVEVLTVRVAELERELEISQAQEEKMDRLWKDCKQQIESFQPERDMMEAKIQEFTNMRRQYDDITEEIKHLATENGRLAAENMSIAEMIQESVSGLHHQWQKYTLTNKQLKSNINKAIMEQSEGPSSEEELVVENPQIEATIYGQVEMLKNISSGVECERKDVNNVINVFERVIAVRGSKLASLQQEKQAIESEVNDLKCSLTTAQADISSEQEKVRTLQSNVSQLLTDVEEMTAEKSQLVDKLTSLNATLALVQEDSKKSADTIATLEQELQGKAQMIEELMSSLRKDSHDQTSFDALQEQLSKQIEFLEEKNKTLISENEEHKAVLMQENEELKQQNQSIISECDNTKADLQHKNGELVTQVSTLTEQVTSVTADRDSLHSQFSAEIQTLKDTNRSVMLEHEQSKANHVQEMEKLQSEYEKKKAEFIQDIEKLKPENKELVAQIDTLTAQVNSLKADLEKNTNLDTLQSELDKEIETLREKNKILTSEQEQNKSELIEEIEKLKSENGKLLSEVSSVQVVVSELTCELEHTHSELRTSQEGTEALQSEISNLQQKLLVMNEEKQKQDKIVEQLTSQCSQKTEEVAVLTSERDVLHEQCSQKAEEVAVLTSERDVLHEQCSQKTEEVAVLTSERDVLHEQCSQKAEEVAVLTSERDVLHEQCSQKAEEVAVLTSERDVLHEQCSQKTEEVAVLTSERDLLHEQCSQKAEEVAVLTSERDVLHEQCSQKAEEVAVLTSERDVLHEQCSQKAEEVAVLTSERDVLHEQCSQKAEEVAFLTSELENYRREQGEVREEHNTQQSADAARGTDLSHKVAQLEKELKDKEGREGKFKQLTLKAKKETQDYKAKLEECQKEVLSLQQALSSTHETSNTQVSNYKSIQVENDRLQNELEDVEKRRRSVESDLQQAVQSLAELREQVETDRDHKHQLTAQLDALTKHIKDVMSEKEMLSEECKAQAIEITQINKDKADLQAQVAEKETAAEAAMAEHRAQLQQSQDKIGQITRDMVQAKRDLQHSSMMDLEYADYERTIQTLNEQVAARDTTTAELQLEMDRLTEKHTAILKQLETAESQYLQSEDRANKLKQLLVKTKKDLSDSKKMETEQKSSDVQMRVQLEALTQQCEEHKLQISGLVGENHALTERLRAHTEVSARSTRALELKLSSVQDELDATTQQYDTVLQEYDGYKVRVHNVLKQQKNKSSDEASLEEERKERQRLESALDQVKLKYSEAAGALSVLQADQRALQDEYERLQQRHSKLVTHTNTIDNTWKDKYERLNEERSYKSTEHVETIKQLQLQLDTVTNTYKEQLRLQSEESGLEVSTLQQRLHQSHSDVYTLERQLQAYATAAASSQRESPTPPAREVLADIPDPRRTERPTVEGMDNTELEACQKSSQIGLNIVPFDELLSSPHTDTDTASIVTLDSPALDESVLRDKLLGAEKRVGHSNELLNESEATVMRLTEQAKILKEEIRRLERNQDRDKAISNMEYLKNIILKFLTLGSEDERQQLIPVLTTMLRLSADEKNKLLTIARGGDAPAKPDGGGAAGWGSYLHRWSGMS